MGHPVFPGRFGKGELVVMVYVVLGFLGPRLLQGRAQGGKEDVPFHQMGPV